MKKVILDGPQEDSWTDASGTIQFHTDPNLEEPDFVVTTSATYILDDDGKPKLICGTQETETFTFREAFVFRETDEGVYTVRLLAREDIFEEAIEKAMLAAADPTEIEGDPPTFPPTFYGKAAKEFLHYLRRHLD